MLDALIQNAVTLILFVAFCFTVTGIGLLILKQIPATATSPGESLFFSFGLGAGVTGYAVFILAAAQLLYPWSLSLLSILLLAIAAAGWRTAGISLSPADFRPRGIVEQGASLLLLLVLAAALLLAMTPEIGRDALMYHLAVPKLYLKHHGFFFVPGNAYANFPLHTELLFLLGLFLKNDILAKLINFAFLPVILLGIRQFALHHLERNNLPYLSMLIFAMIPSVFIDAHMAYSDFAVTLTTMSALIAFINWNGRKERGWLLICAIFTGLALASKYTTLFLPFLAFLGILLAHRNAEKTGPVFRDLALYLTVTALCGAPFFIKNWLITGNPLYPFLYGIFGGKGWDPELARLTDGIVLYMGMGRGLVDYLLLPWNLSVYARMDSFIFDGVIGPLFLVVLPFLAAIRPKETPLKIIMVYSVLLFMFWASASQQIRYLFAIFPFLALMTGTVLTRFREKRVIALLLAASVAGCLLFDATWIVRDFRKVRPLGVVIGAESRDAFLGRSLSTYRMYRYASENLPPDVKIYLIYMKNWTYLCDRECYADSMFEHFTLQKILTSSATPEEVYRKIKGMGFSHMMYDVNYVTGEMSMLTPEEKALFTAFQEKYLILVKNERFFYLYRLSGV